MTKDKRRRAVAEAFAELAQMERGGEAEDPKPWDELPEEDRDDALRFAESAIKLVDALLAPLAGRES